VAALSMVPLDRRCNGENLANAAPHNISGQASLRKTRGRCCHHNKRFLGVNNNITVTHSNLISNSTRHVTRRPSARPRRPALVQVTDFFLFFFVLDRFINSTWNAAHDT
jgi:hypothetical protein